MLTCCLLNQFSIAWRVQQIIFQKLLSLSSLAVTLQYYKPKLGLSLRKLKRMTSKQQIWWLGMTCVAACVSFLPENVAVGTDVRRFPDRFSSTRLVRPRKAVGSIWPSLQSERKSFCRFKRPRREKTSRGRIWRLFPDKSSTWVSISTFSGIDIWPLSRHSTQRFPARYERRKNSQWRFVIYNWTSVCQFLNGMHRFFQFT